MSTLNAYDDIARTHYQDDWSRATGAMVLDWITSGTKGLEGVYRVKVADHVTHIGPILLVDGYPPLYVGVYPTKWSYSIKVQGGKAVEVPGEFSSLSGSSCEEPQHDFFVVSTEDEIRVIHLSQWCGGTNIRGVMFPLETAFELMKGKLLYSTHYGELNYEGPTVSLICKRGIKNLKFIAHVAGILVSIIISDRVEVFTTARDHLPSLKEECCFDETILFEDKGHFPFLMPYLKDIVDRFNNIRFFSGTRKFHETFERNAIPRDPWNKLSALVDTIFND